MRHSSVKELIFQTAINYQKLPKTKTSAESFAKCMRRSSFTINCRSKACNFTTYELHQKRVGKICFVKHKLRRKSFPETFSKKLFKECLWMATSACCSVSAQFSHLCCLQLFNILLRNNVSKDFVKTSKKWFAQKLMVNNLMTFHQDDV